jgi:hypothetical protein
VLSDWAILENQKLETGANGRDWAKKLGFADQKTSIL